MRVTSTVMHMRPEYIASSQKYKCKYCVSFSPLRNGMCARLGLWGQRFVSSSDIVSVWSVHPDFQLPNFLDLGITRGCGDLSDS